MGPPPDPAPAVAGPLGAPAADTFGSYTPARSRSRLDSVDLLRGIVMVIMMLDHTREFIHASVLQFDPLDPARTHPVLFFTRWITHFCAPVFVFLAGTGAYLQLARGKSRGELSRFLWTRGLWLIVLEFTVVRFLVFFNVSPALAGFMQVIWVTGVGMILLAALIHLPLRWVAAFGIGMMALHNLLDGIQVAGWRGPDSPVPSIGAKLWMILHNRFSVFPIGSSFPSPLVVVLYPLIPWVGVLAAGYAFGSLYQMDAERRQRRLVRLGTLMVAAFLVLRAFNYAGNPYGAIPGQHGYGDPQPWRTALTVPANPGAPPAANAPTRTVELAPVGIALSFLNVTKYPPSLLFLLMTLGPAMLALAWFERIRLNPLTRALVTFGRVPLFFYLLQWLVSHGFAVLLALAAGQSVARLFAAPWDWPTGEAARGLGFNLWVVYAVWLAGVALLYPVCRWYAGVKQRRRDWWLSYL
jgi:uncharacterized membrane protein